MCSKGKCLLKCCGGIREVPSSDVSIYDRTAPTPKRKKSPDQQIPTEEPGIAREQSELSLKEPLHAEEKKSIEESLSERVTLEAIPKIEVPPRESSVEFMSTRDEQLFPIGKDKQLPPMEKMAAEPGLLESPSTRDASTSIDKHMIKSRRSMKRMAPTSPSEPMAKTSFDEPEKDTTKKDAELKNFKSSGYSFLTGVVEEDFVIHEGKPAETIPIVPVKPENFCGIFEKPKVHKKRKRGPQEVKYGFLLPPTRTPPKLLLVFSQSDQVVETQTRAAEKLGFETTLCNSEETALEEFQAKSHDLVIIDTRTSKALDYNTLCRSIRNTRGSQHTVLIAIVRKSFFEKDDVAVMALLDSGFNRCIVENTNLMYVVNEMIQVKHSDVQPMAQHATCQSVYAALDKCKDVVVITDESFKVQYSNRACEKVLNVRPEDIQGKTLQEQLAHDNLQITTMASTLLRGREWSGSLTLKKKNQEPLTATCRAIPITCAGRVPTHFVLVVDAAHSLDAVLSQSRGSVHSIRRGSNDVRSVGSDFYRRTSLAKLNSFPLEAPITKIIGLIDQARETSGNTQVVQILDRVEDILRCPELYQPQVKEDRHDEPIVSELITALLSKQSQPALALSSRRSSNDSSVYRPSKGGVIKVPAALRELLDTSLSWEFDIFRLEELTKKRPLQYLGMSLFTHFEVASVLNCDEKTLYNWLIIIEANYHVDNSYHNSTHAADVMQATAGFLEREKLKSIMDTLDEATSLIAAAAHDVDHPGKSNAFLANSDNPLAILYNDITILESHHAALMFKLTLGDERVNIFKNLDKEAYKIARHNVIDMILATEMTKHFEHLAKFVNVFCTKPSAADIDLDGQEFPSLALPENITLIKRMMIKCSDVSNPTRPLRLCIEWARRIAEEYFQQTDEEKERGLPVVMPMFDRYTCSIPKSQIGFVDYIINDMFEAWNAFIDMPELITFMRQNYIRWKEFDEQGLITLADINKIQSNVLMCPKFPIKPSKSD